MKTYISFEDQYFQREVFLSAPNKSEDLFFPKYSLLFKSEYFAQFKIFYNGTENSVEALAISLCTFTPMSTNIFIARTGT